jgi:hypothetical protein
MIILANLRIFPLVVTFVTIFMISKNFMPKNFGNVQFGNTHFDHSAIDFWPVRIFNFLWKNYLGVFGSLFSL